MKVELELNAMMPAAERGVFSLRLILHGRRVCFARRPSCDGVRAERLLPLGAAAAARSAADVTNVGAVTVRSTRRG